MQSVEYDVFRTALAIPGILITQSKIQTLKKSFTQLINMIKSIMMVKMILFNQDIFCDLSVQKCGIPKIGHTRRVAESY